MRRLRNYIETHMDNFKIKEVLYILYIMYAVSSGLNR